MLVPWLSTLLILGCSYSLVHAEYIRGCTHDPTLCDRGEYCYDDGAFGVCHDLGARRGDLDPWMVNLRDPERAAVASELQPLLARGYSWSDPYFQCVVDRILVDLRFFKRYPSQLAACEPLRVDIDEDKGDGDPTLATIRFSPSDGQYADEVYYPGPGRDKPSRMDILALAMGEEAKNKPHQLSTTRLTFSPPVFYGDAMNEVPRGLVHRDKKVRRSLETNILRHLDTHRPASDFLHKQYNTPQRFRAGFESRDDDPVDLDVALSLLSGRPEELRSFSRKYNTPKSFRQGLEYHDPALRYLEEARVQEEPEPQVVEADDQGDEEGAWISLLGDLVAADRKAEADAEAEAARISEEGWSGDDSEVPAVEMMPQSFSRVYNTPDSFRAGLETKDVREDGGLLGAAEPVFIRPSRGPAALVQDQEPEGNDIPDLESQQEAPDLDQLELERDLELEQAQKELSKLLQVYLTSHPTQEGVPEEIQAEEDEVDQAPGRAYTEGGLVFLPDKQTDAPDSLGSLISDLRAFERRERLDVKKPGPPYSINNYAFRTDKAREENSAEVQEPVQVKGEPRSEAIYGSPPISMIQQKSSDETSGPATNPDVVNVKLKNGIVGHDVSFQVDPAETRMNASEVARQIMERKDEIQKRISNTISSASASGNSGNFESRDARPLLQSDSLMLGSVVAGVTLGAALISAVTYLVIRRMHHSRDKLRGMAAPDSEASKDYQDLCRARMAKKAEAERPGADPLHLDQRVASLSRESECSNNSPSSRSSTSSWTEEPAFTNMDISTGHMVLAYMEDHLKNKDRLEQEWQGLCAYEAEPCELTVAQKPENVKKNRYAHVLPYDHSRVVLNELANASGSDYINASTITDHDPRNPAYLATQGPLPHTAADVWQLVWEQGSVVMVMLTRLTENGTAMCHRYWPEEGSELYHIYEVHLVSEHIWCDDYLVRSFYLKNLKTGETRTVTQFHFLSWPDHGVPPSTKPLLDFRRKVNKSYRGRSCPIVVHCSDGAGRTGTYCLIDMVLNRMAKGVKEIDIAATLEHIRDQRANMVESREQFEFCLQAVADEVHAILKALPAQPTPPATAVAPQPTSPAPAPATKQQQEQPKKKT